VTVSQPPTAAQSNPEALEQLQRELSDRQSIVNLAHAGVSFVVVIIMGLTAGKLFWDSVRVPYLGIASAIIAVAAAIYCAVRYQRGQRLLADERARFAQMMALREALHLDDPSALLPQ
jgi:hypothetical protein